MKKNLVISVERKKIFIVSFCLFLFFLLFHNWQVSTSNYYLTLGNGNYVQNEYAKALKNYKYAATIGGSNSVVYMTKFKRAEIFYKFGFLDEAEEELVMAMKKNRYNYRAYDLLGNVYYDRKEIDDAIKYYEKAISLEGKDDISIKLARSFIIKGDFKKAYDIISNLFLEGKDDEEILYHLGLFAFDKNAVYNNYFQSIESHERYKIRMEKIKSSVDNYKNLEDDDYYDSIVIANLFNMINEPCFAIHKINSVTEKNLNYRDAWIVLGKSYFIIENYEKSIESFNKAFELDANNPEINFWIGSAYRKLGNNVNADSFFNRYEMLIN